MGPASYLLHVNSGPKQVSGETWKEWYKTEHLPDLYNAKSCERATFYEEIAHPLGAEPNHPRAYLALYQSVFEELLKSEEYKGEGVRHSSALFEKGGANSSLTQDNGDFDARNYHLWQEYNPGRLEGEQLSPQILCVYMNPSDEEDFEKWYREEHLAMLAKLSGYRRSLRYKIGPRTPLTQGEPPAYLAIHEVDDVSSAFSGPDAEAANSTPWTVKHIKESSPFIVRAFKRLTEQGY